MQTYLESKYPKQRYVKFEKVVREKIEGGYYHMPATCNSPENLFDTIIALTDATRETQEIFGVISMNTRLKVIGCNIIHKGSVSSSIVSPRDVFKEAITCGAACIAIFHNHPSDNCSPSSEDLDVTERIVEAGKIMGIDCIDHIIVGDGVYLSMKEKGYM